jgi:hypothetical protein
VAELDREAIRTSVVDRFSAERMADGYEALYARVLGLEDEGDGIEPDADDIDHRVSSCRPVAASSHRGPSARASS